MDAFPFYDYDEVYHHQTCQATFNTNRGSIGTIAESHIILDKLKKQLATGHMPVIVCSKRVCGCGMCLSKAKTDEDIKDLFSKTVLIGLFIGDRSLLTLARLGLFFL